MSKAARKKRFGNIIFLIGLALTTACVGFMVGASETPVAGIIIPAIFGVVASLLGAVQRTQLLQAIQDRRKSADQESDKAAQNNLADILEDFEKTSLRVGIALIVFALAYFTSLITGIAFRVSRWHEVFLPSSPVIAAAASTPAPIETEKSFPWPEDEIFSDAEIALNWLCFQELLIFAGYSHERVQTLYAQYHNANLTLPSQFYTRCFGYVALSEEDDQPVPLVSPPLPPFQPNISRTILSQPEIIPNQPEEPQQPEESSNLRPRPSGVPR